MTDTQQTNPKQDAPTEPEYEIAFSKAEINDMPMGQYEGPIHLVRSGEDPTAGCEALASDPLLGFDTETRPAFRKGQSYLPSLVQLANRNEVWLFQLNGNIPAPLKALLGSAENQKAGVALGYDLRKLNELDPIEPAGFMAIERLAQALRIRNQGLRGLAAAVLGFRISKRAQCSNWAREDLNEAQIRYAATDAWISRAIYVELARRMAERDLAVSELDHEVKLTPPEEKRPPRRPRRRRKLDAPKPTAEA